MAKHPPRDPGESEIEIGEREESAVGIPAIASSLSHGLKEMGAIRTARTLSLVNQDKGFDCMGCAWPDPAKRHHAEFCENGAKAVAEEATLLRAEPSLFEQWPVAEMRERSDFWIGKRGRLTDPMWLGPGAGSYEPISWDDAYGLIAEELDALDTPDEAVFYTSGRTSNEAAFAYQAFVSALGTNNLPDCSNMCHESSGDALNESIGIGKGSVTLEDIEAADLLIVVGQNPGTNHPRMLTSLEKAKRDGAHIVAINPLPEAGLIRFKNPQRPRGVIGRGTALADLHIPIRVNGDLGAVPGGEPDAARRRRHRPRPSSPITARDSTSCARTSARSTGTWSTGPRGSRASRSPSWSRWQSAPSGRSSAGRWA